MEMCCERATDEHGADLLFGADGVEELDELLGGGIREGVISHQGVAAAHEKPVVPWR